MIVITGAAGFIGSCLAGHFNKMGHQDLVLVDDFNWTAKEPNYTDKNYSRLVDRDGFDSWLNEHGASVDFVYHLGARTDTTEFDLNVFQKLNLEFSKKVWQHCSTFDIPLVYASSAATYGGGEHGFDDEESKIELLKPLNPYGWSKQHFDQWALEQEDTPPYWVGLKFFNVYGPNEFHKGRMASVVFHAYNQIVKTGKVRLFKSHNPDYEDGKQLRDFIYVEDVLAVCDFVYSKRISSGIYNLGTGKARTFFDLAKATFEALGKTTDIEYIDMPVDIRDNYQYFTEAPMNKLKQTGFADNFTSLEAGIHDYVKNYLQPNNYY